MNPYIPKLHSALESQCGVGVRELRDGLFLLRAPYNLAGIVICCRRLVELVDRFEWLQSAADIEGYATFVGVVRAIAMLEGADPHFIAAKTSRNKRKETPLRPFSGDSALCDLLLIEPSRDASEAQQAAYTLAQAWFAAQVIRYQAKVQSRREYDAYLDQVERQTDMVRLVRGLGSRAYGAMRLLRMLGDPEHADLAVEVVTLLGGDGVAGSPALAELLRASLNKRGGFVAGLLGSRLGVSADEARQRIVHVRELDRRFGQRTQGEDSADLRLLSRFLEAVWLKGKGGASGRSLYVRNQIRAEQRTLDVERYGEIEALPQRVDDGIAGRGILVDLRIREERQRLRDADSEVPAHQDSEDEPTEPELQIFLGDGDPVGAYYAAKSASHHIETENALLRWPRWRLSQTGVQAVVDLIAAAPGGEPLTEWARLLIATSLVTGRRLPVAHVELVTDGLPPTEKLAITLADRVLHVPAGRPQLKGHKDSPDPLPEFCAPWASTLRLPLPQAWHPLLDRLANASRPRLSRIEREAQRLLDTLPLELAASEKAIAHALKLALLEAGQDDLGLVKVLTDASDANTANLIHYASYHRGEVEALWRRIVGDWAGPLGQNNDLPTKTGERVGAPFGIETDKVARAVADLKAECRAAIDIEDWARAQTLLVLYLSMWLGLGTAGRGTRHPIPPFISEGGWALVQDKHRPDASTDRLLPLTERLRRQIDVVRGLTEAFGVVDPSFAAPDPEAPTRPPLRVIVDGDPVPFQPSHWRLVESIRALPRNWARRLIRSDSPELVGRFKDAGLGHWVRGRHPWSWTSTFPAQVFGRDWLAMQARFESELGFDLLDVPQLAGVTVRPSICVSWGSGGHVRAPAPTRAASEMTEEEIRALLRECGQNGEFEAVFEATPPVREAARWLLTKAVVARHRALRVQRGRAVPLPVADAEAIAAYIRTETKQPVFAVPPRSRFQRNWLPDAGAFHDGIRIQRDILPTIDKDLRSLPSADEGREVRVGRLIAAAALRAGVLDTQHIDALFVAITKNSGIDAVGEARLVELLARSKRTAMPVRRTVFLEPYLSVLLMTERHVLDGDLQANRDRLDRHRYTVWNERFQAYLAYLGIADRPTLPCVLSALRQKLMIESSPILAAYASAELFTHDLPISEFRRLAGFEIRPSAVSDDRLNEDAWHDDAKQEEEALPNDLQRGVINLARKFSVRQSRYLSEWLRLTRDDLKSVKTATERLFGQFALHMLEAEREHQSGKHNAKLGPRFRRDFKRNLTIVWAALAQFRERAEALNPLGANTVRQLMDLTVEHFAARRHRAAWSRFRAFLQSGDADASGIAIALGNDPADEYVSAKILSREEMDRVEARLGSVQSGIGTATNRRAAQGHFALTRDIGARRSETELLRQVDLDAELIRIQEYEGRTLKTKASTRVVPVQLLAAELRARVERRSGESKVLESMAGGSVSGANFFDGVSKAMKEATGDPDLGLHHLRHTKASLMLLRLLDNVTPLDRLATVLPWLFASLPSRDEAGVLLGSAGQAGQGMKAVSALLGHLHETTTLHHYVHTLCIVMHAHILAQPRIPLPAAFRRRLPMGSSLYRHQQTLEASGLSAGEVDYRLRSIIEAHREKAADRAHPERQAPARVRRSRPAVERPAVRAGSREQTEAIELLTRWESLQRYLDQREGPPPDDIENVQTHLRHLAAIPSGKVGAMRPRHPMPRAGFDGTPLPAPLLAGKPVRHAAALIAWLIRMHRDHRADFDWLMDRWRHASHSVSGAMRLTLAGDFERTMALSRNDAVRLKITEIHQTKSRIRNNAKPRYQMTIKLGRSADASAPKGGEEERAGRSAGAVRWVMTWAAVAWARTEAP